MLAATCCFMTMGVAGRELSQVGYGTFDTMVYRSVLGLAMVLPIALVTAGPRALITSRPFGHLTRNAVHFVGQFSWFYGIAFLPLIQVTALTSTMPLYGAVFAAIFLKERIGLTRAIVIGLAFSGVLVILQPGRIPIEHAALVTLFGTAGYAGAAILVKDLTRTEHAISIVFYMMLMQTPMALIPALMSDGGLRLPSWAEAHWLFAVGASGILAHFTMARALAIANASQILPVSYAQFPMIAVIGFLFYAEIPSVWTLLGSLLIVAANWYNLKRG